MAPPREKQTRRQVIGRTGAVLAGTLLAGCSSSPNEDNEKGTTTTDKKTVDSGQQSLRKLGQIRPAAQSSPTGGYSEVAVRADGRYAVVGTKWGIDGTYLVDISDPDTLKQVHYLDSSNDAPNLDVKFDHRNGLYYRAIEETWPGNFEIIDYGYATGTPTSPTVMSTVAEGKSHNVTPHPRKPVLYTVNYGLKKNGFDVYDTSDPTAPRKLSEHGPQGAGHDISVDPERELLCCAYQSGEFIGFIIYDISEPRDPIEIGRFDYSEQKSYSQARVGEEAFGSAHHGHFDPRRELLVIGDERPQGIPGGKHVFDIGWEDGSLSNPIPVGFTVSPNAQRMDKGDYADRFDWTGHHFNIVPQGKTTLIVSADWHDGVVVYDITDPTEPQPTDRYQTDDGADTMTPNDKVARLGSPPMAWKTAHTSTGEREFVVASDTFTGLYTFELTKRSR
ncbi:LVIVD repeat-containing protein [Haladaptatus sp. NG-SE-30]